MSRRVVAPILLLLAAACSIAAVFAVHRIEAEGGPLAEPSAIPPVFSPNGDGIQDRVTIAFTTRREEHVTVDIVDADGERVARLLDDERVDGEVQVDWDGAGAADGRYQARITRAGDARTYSTPGGIVLDTTPPLGVVDRGTLDGDRLRGLAMLMPGEDLVLMDARANDELPVIRIFGPYDPNAASAQPRRSAPEGTRPMRFIFDTRGLPLDALRLLVEDAAGNRREVDDLASLVQVAP